MMVVRQLACSLILIISGWPALAATNSFHLTYAAAPANNPLKGFVPYAGDYATFPHSMEWNYLPLRALMTGPTNFNWSLLDNLLNDIAGRGHQVIFRVYLDYPTLTTGIPQYLLDAGLTTHSYSDYGNVSSVSPDYNNPLLRQALTNFVRAMGSQYDGDPRIGFITVGLLGFWGEWHTYPHDTWFAPIQVQDDILNAYEASFVKTKFLLRQPYGTNPSNRRLGYHDDSFAYSTIDPPDWHFLGALKAAGETNKWQSQPIGGEVSPEVQACLWDASSCVPAGQEFLNCVQLTHASWMLNHGAFDPGFTGVKLTNALAGACRLGYELFIANVTIMDARASYSLVATIALRNLGVAPFYYDWPVQLRAVNSSNQTVQTWDTNWKLPLLLPATTNTVWSLATNHSLIPGRYQLLLRVANPLTNGVPFRFANQTQDADHPGWLTLGTFSVLPDLVRPWLWGEPVNENIRINISGTQPASWTLETSSNLRSWRALFTTNGSATNWYFTDPTIDPVRFYRVRGAP
jgi:hypothetical protein